MYLNTYMLKLFYIYKYVKISTLYISFFSKIINYCSIYNLYYIRKSYFNKY